MKIHTLDLNYQNVPETIAAYLVVGPKGVVLVETGPGSTLPTLLKQLARYDVQPIDVKYVLVTHIHLDHSGAAGWWAQQGAQLFVHPIGAPHLIDPSKLLTSASRIYGDKMGKLWGETVAAPTERVTAVYDNDIIEVAGLSFTALDTPGHASHHHVYRLQDIGFVGDSSGIHLPGMPLADLPAPPPEFHLEKWEATIDRLLAENFRAIYLGHFGIVEDVADYLLAFKKLVQQAAVFVRQQMEAGLEQNQLIANYENWNRQRAQQLGVSEQIMHRYKTANPWYMSLLGIMRYWRKQGIG
jgi:glyoxylase-like metal-dependent hydrolase (beta-lactamase superfamily II)